VKFNDADLIGIPLQITVGERGLKEGLVEIKQRKDGQVRKAAVAEAVTAAAGILTIKHS